MSVGEVGAIILVDSETESAFEGANMILKEVGVFVKVDCFESEFAETLTAIGICAGEGSNASAAEFATGTILGIDGLERFGHIGLGRTIHTW